jgi:hypothetical protein
VDKIETFNSDWLIEAKSMFTMIYAVNIGFTVFDRGLFFAMLKQSPSWLA